MAAINEALVNRRIAMVLAILAAGGMAFYYLAILLPNTRATEAHPTIGRYSFGNDFYQVWLTSSEALPSHLDPYSLTITHKIQTGIFGHELNSSSPDHPPDEYRAFAYPAFADIFGLPLAWLPFSTARILLAIILSSLTAASVFLWMKGLGGNVEFRLWIIFAALTLSSYQGLEALYALQPGLIAAFLLAATIAALAANQLRLAGCLLAFSTIKPQLSALLILYLLLWSMASWRERQKFALTFLFTVAALCSAAMLVWPAWMIGWWRAMTRYPSYYSRPSLPEILGTHFGSVVLALMLVVAIKLAWSHRREEATSFRFGLTVSLLLAITTVTILPAHAVYDHVILLPGIVAVMHVYEVIWQRNLIAKGILVLAAGALFWQWILALPVVIVRIAAPHLVSAMLLLPLRTAAAIPFVEVALLLLMIWRMNGNQDLVLTT